MALGDGIGRAPRSSADINIVPLVDVMLVLLIIFIVAAPLITQAVKVDLPQAHSQPARSDVTPVVISIDSRGAVFWDGVPLPPGEFEARARELAARPNVPMHIAADRAAQYDAVAQVLAAAARAGVRQLGFVTNPSTASSNAKQEIP